MKTQNFKFAALALLMAGVVSCTPKEPDVSLKGTTWKLVGFADVETGTLRKAVPEDCKRCYTITFNTDSTCYGHGFSNPIDYGIYKVDYEMSKIKIIYVVVTKVVPYFDENLFVETVNMVQYFSMQEDELKLYYNNKKNYLLFNKKES
jgi:hypothetical protein